MPKASELKRGSIIEFNKMLFVIKNIDVRSPSSRGAQTLYKMRLTNLSKGNNLEETFKADDLLTEQDVARRGVQYLYREDDNYTFMDTEDYMQYPLSEDALGEQSQWLVDGQENITALIFDENIVAIELPTTLTLEVSDTAPAIKGASAQARTKTATLSTGAEIQVPEYLESGQMVKVNTTTGKYVSRA